MVYSPASTLMPAYDSWATGQSGILNSYSPTTVLSKLGEPILYIIRHAQVDLDVKNLVRGLLNPSLNEKGKRDAQQLPDFFRDIPLSAIVVDDSDRTKQTVLPLAGDKDIEIEVDTGLRSWDAGTELEGKPIEDNEEEIEELRNQPDQIPVGGQSWREFTNQVNDALYKYIGRSMSGTPLAIVTHGSFIQVVWTTLGEEDTGGKYLDIPIEPCGIAAIFLTRDGFKPKVLEGGKENLDE